MSLIYKPKRFDPRELISPGIYAICGADALYMYDPLVLEGADQLSIHYGGFIANTWWSKKLTRLYGYHRFRGLRAIMQKIGARLSAHKIGIKKYEKIKRPGKVPYSGLDGICPNMSVLQLHHALMSDQKYWSKFFKRIESHKKNRAGIYVPITWFHGDSKPHNLGAKLIKYFKP